MPNPHDASASFLGYLYQSRVALADSLARLRQSEIFTVTIEAADDVVFERDDGAAHVLQTKHHLHSRANLNDASRDVWKTLRIWIEGRANGSFSRDAVLHIMTTESAGSGSAVSYLRPDAARSIESARERLDATAQTSASADNRAIYRKYLALDIAEREALLAQVVVLDRSDNIGGLDAQLHQHLALSVERQHVALLLAQLEGWWHRRVVMHLLGDDKGIQSEALRDELDRLREQYRSDNLPIHDDLAVGQEVFFDESAFSDYVFVEQLRIIGVSEARIVAAMRYFYRAFQQRSRWSREGVLRADELGRYDSRLIEEWQLRFNQRVDELVAGADEEANRRCARQIYQWAEVEANILIRPACTDPVVSRGSLQLLADKVRVGWHPDFRSRFIQHMDEEET